MKLIRLTKLQRYTAYIFMLEYMKGCRLGKHRSAWCNMRYPAGLCYVVHDVFGIISNPGSIKYNLLSFPELMTKLHEWRMSSTKEGWSDRIAALRACIEETHPDNKHI